MNHHTSQDAFPVDASAARDAMLSGMTYAPHWTIAMAQSGRTSPEQKQKRIFFVPPSQGQLRKDFAEAFPGQEVRFADSEEALPPGVSHLIFVSRSSWTAGILDADLASLLQLVRNVESRDDIALDVITGQAISCPLFSCADHPQDGVYIGLAQTLALERPEWRVRSLCVRGFSPNQVAKVLDLDLPETPGHPVCIDGNRVATIKMMPVDLGVFPQNSAFRRGGTYIILGGTGGLGSMLAEYLARHYSAYVVLVGRRPAADSEALVSRLRSAGAVGVDRHEADLSDEQALRRILEKYPKINGVIHSALVLDDATFATMTEDNLLDVLRPKVHGSRSLIEALRGRQVDFCLFFSSVQSYLANAGQGNYTAASVAADSFADLMRAALALDARVINWGFWGSIGVVAKPEYRERMAQLGVESIEPAEGLAVIERFLAGDERQITVVKASDEALRRMQIMRDEVMQSTPQHQDNDFISVRSVVPTFDPNSPELANHRDFGQRLQDYARSALERIELPDTVSSRHSRLLAALQAIPKPVNPVSREELMQTMPELEGHLNLLDRCVESLPAVLRDEVDPLEVLFPGGSFDLVAPVYRDNPIADYFNEVSAQVVAAYQRALPEHELKIIEIGGGTGSTTGFVLAKLTPKNVSYTFTDLSHSFLHRAQDAFSQYSFVQYEICDVSDIDDSRVGKFDVVVATNVVHATSDVPGALRNIRRMLRDGGILVLSEITARQDYATLTFGLTDGWWLANDPYRLDHSPLLSSEQWVQVLSETGFGEVEIHGSPEQQVLVAMSGKMPGGGQDSVGVVESSVSGSAPEPSSDSEEEVLSRVEGYLQEVVAETMRFSVEEVERDRPFRDMGIDSLIAMELLKPLREWLGYVPATVLFEFPTVQRLAEHLVQSYADQVGVGRPQSGLANDSVGVVESSVSGSAPEPSSDSEEVIGLAPATERSEDIAIIGMSARLPCARDIDHFWQNLVDGVDSFSSVPPERWTIDITEGDPALSYTDRGAFIDDIDAFDHTFFSITPRDARVMDPQERLVLEESYLALLHAGYSREGWAGSDTGVFVGVMNGGWAWHTPLDTEAPSPTSLFWSMANRLSYHFDWHGPSMAVDSACSASMSALHVACRSLRNGDCDQAVVSGVNLITHPRQYRLLSEMGMLSAKGVCRPFGDGADGFVDGEGVVSVVLKPLAAAIRDGDRVHAVVSGSALNSGGRSNGYTAPNVEAQRRVISRALRDAGVTPSDVGYVEAHGTGTELGDPIEARALSDAYADAGLHRIRLGSVKSNIGHLESAAGLAGIVKVILQMKYRKIAPSLHADTSNRHLDLDSAPFVLNRELASWPQSLPLVSAISSFGAGGANAHVVLRGEAERSLRSSEVGLTSPQPTQPKTFVLPLSHHSSAGLQLMMDDLHDMLSDTPEIDLEAVAHTLGCRRDHLRYRIAVIGRNRDELMRELRCDLQRRYDPQSRTMEGKQAIDECKTAADLAARFEDGELINWADYYSPRPAIPLPAYPFLNYRHWTTSQTTRPRDGDAELLMSAHRIGGEKVVPAAWTLSILIDQARPRALGRMLWQRRIVDPSRTEVVQDGDSLSIVDRESGLVFCSAEIVDPGVPSTSQWDVGRGQRRRGKEIYENFRRRGYDYGSKLQGIRWAEVNDATVRAFLYVDPVVGDQIAPALLDAGMQLSILLSSGDGAMDKGRPSILVPYQVGRMTVYRIPQDEPIYGECTLRERSDSAQTSTFDFRFTDVGGNEVITLEEVVSVSVPATWPQVDGKDAPVQTISEQHLVDSSSSSFEVFEL